MIKEVDEMPESDSEDEAMITWPDNGVDTQELVDWEAEDVELNE